MSRRLYCMARWPTMMLGLACAVGCSSGTATPSGTSPSKADTPRPLATNPPPAPPPAQALIAPAATALVAKPKEASAPFPKERRPPAPTVTVLLPADKATNVDPQYARIILLVSKELVEPPAGELVVETRQGDAWAPSAHTATGDYNPTTHEWRWRLTPASYPPGADVRITLTPSAGVDASGQQLSRRPISWTFSTATSSASSRLPGLKGGCPVAAGEPAAKMKVDPKLAPCPH
jgi:hypothetical protein